MASSSSNDIPDDVYSTPITIKDVMAMLVVPEEKISPNERPFAREAIKCNNALLREWKEKVLDKIAKDDKVASGRAFYSWLLFLEGKSVTRLPELRERGAIYEVPDETIQYWKSFFEEKNVAEMHSYGAGTVSFGWRIIEDHMKMQVTKIMYDRFFSLSDDPLDWEKNHANHKFLQTNCCDVLWPLEQLRVIREKVITILKIQVEPSK
jgi:hypothetical protein